MYKSVWYYARSKMEWGVLLEKPELQSIVEEKVHAEDAEIAEELISF